MKNQSDTVSTVAGLYPIERRPSDWKKTAGALSDASEQIKAAIQMIESEANG